MSETKMYKKLCKPSVFLKVLEICNGNYKIILF